MVLENIEILLSNIGVHIPPEFPLSLEERIDHLVPDWEVYKKSDDTTYVRSKDKRASIALSSRETSALCKGPYGENLGHLRTIGTTIRRIGDFSRRKDIQGKLAKSKCNYIITLDDIPSETILENRVAYFVPMKNLKDKGYDPLKFRKGIDLLKKDRPVIYLVPNENLTKIEHSSNFYDFLTKYEHLFSKVFTFHV